MKNETGLMELVQNMNHEILADNRTTKETSPLKNMVKTGNRKSGFAQQKQLVCNRQESASM